MRQKTDTSFLKSQPIQHPIRQLSVGRLTRLLDAAEEGDINALAFLAYDIVSKDPQIFAEVSKRQRQILTFPYTVNATHGGARDQKTASKLYTILSEIPDFEDVLLQMNGALLLGFSVHEIEWILKNELQTPILHARPPHWFCTSKKDRDTLLLRTQTAQNIDGTYVFGEPLREFSWVVHCHRSLPGALTQTGLVRLLSYLYLLKHSALIDFASTLSIFGRPMIQGTYPQGTSQEEVNVLADAISTLGAQGRIVLPEGMALEVRDIMNSSAEPFLAMIGYVDRYISKVIVGGTLTTDADAGTKTNALGNVHQQAFFDLAVADSMQIASTITEQILRPIITINKLGNPNAYRFSFQINTYEEMGAFSQGLQNLVATGMGRHIAVFWVKKKLGIPDATPEEMLEVAPANNASEEPKEDTMPSPEEDDLPSPKEALKKNAAQDVSTFEEHLRDAASVLEHKSMLHVIDFIMAALSVTDNLHEMLSMLPSILTSFKDEETELQYILMYFKILGMNEYDASLG